MYERPAVWRSDLVDTVRTEPQSFRESERTPERREQLEIAKVCDLIAVSMRGFGRQAVSDLSHRLASQPVRLQFGRCLLVSEPARIKQLNSINCTQTSRRQNYQANLHFANTARRSAHAI